MTQFLTDHLGNIIIETPDYANYDERLVVMADLEQLSSADELENGRIIFNIIFNHPAFDNPDSRDCHDPRYLDMLERAFTQRTSDTGSSNAIISLPLLAPWTDHTSLVEACRLTPEPIGELQGRGDARTQPALIFLAD